MNWLDDDDQLSVRHGTPQGKSTENRMLDAMGGQDTIKKRFQTNVDGSVVMAHTRGPGTQPEFIVYPPELIEAVCMLGMDSGVIDITSAGAVMDANSNDPGKLLYTQYVNDYIIANTPPTLTTPIIDVINPPETLGVPQIVGSDAKSFMTGSYSKKRVAVLCPPSVFTGKTRLYVQAMYGKHEAVSTISLAPTVGVLTPSIILSNGLEITTSCGVYLDPVTANHYLIKVTSTDVEIYQMFATTCAEKLRVKLLDVSISANDKERIEAYILANSLPSIGSLVSLNYSTGFNINQFGYGWHWNWSGTACDIVSTTYQVTTNTSTHHRITISHTPYPEMAWTQTPSVIEGPKVWNNDRHLQVVCYPVWDYSGLQKIGTVNPPSGDAPYYVFYNRDAVKVCRFYSGSNVNNKSRSRSPSYYNSGIGVTMGSDALEVRQHENWTGAVITLTCGGSSVSYQSGSYTESLHSRSSPVIVPLVITSSGQFYKEPYPRFAPAAVKTNRPPILPLTTYSDAYEGSITIYTGGTGPDAGGTGTYPTVTIPFPTDGSRTAFPEAFGADSNWTQRDGSSNYLHVTGFIAAIPFYDAEAVCLQGDKTIYFSESGTEIQKTGGWFYRRIWSGLNSSSLPDTLESTYQTFWDGSGGTVSSSAYSIPQYTKSFSEAIFVESGVGSSPGVSIPTKNAFHNTSYSIVPVLISQFSSASGNATFNSDVGVNVGNAPASLTGIPFTYAGWA